MARGRAKDFSCRREQRFIQRCVSCCVYGRFAGRSWDEQGTLHQLPVDRSVARQPMGWYRPEQSSLQKRQFRVGESAADKVTGLQPVSQQALSQLAIPQVRSTLLFFLTHLETMSRHRKFQNTKILQKQLWKTNGRSKILSTDVFSMSSSK